MKTFLLRFGFYCKVTNTYRDKNNTVKTLKPKFIFQCQKKYINMFETGVLQSITPTFLWRSVFSLYVIKNDGHDVVKTDRNI